MKYYNKFKDISHIISYRFNGSLINPFLMFESTREVDGTYARFISNRAAYGEKIAEDTKTIRGIKKKDFSAKEHMEACDHAHSKR